MKGISSAKDWRLFSAGLHGLVIEHKLELEFDEDLDDHDSYQHQPRNSWPVTSGAVWCMKFNEVGRPKMSRVVTFPKSVGARIPNTFGFWMVKCVWFMVPII